MSAHLRLLIAALGGEGGGVLASWITDAAVNEGLAAQRTSIPGVAQRTGATTYYIELIAGTEGRRPVMALNPTPGEVDLVVASELMEAARVVQGGFVTPQRTCVIASTHRATSSSSVRGRSKEATTFPSTVITSIEFSSSCSPPQ